MRWAWALIVLLVPLGGAQTQVMDDGENDAASTVAGGVTAPDGVAETGPYDLVGFFVEEAPDAFTFSLRVRDLALDSSAFGNGQVVAQFQHGDRIFRITWFRYETIGVGYNGQLSVYEGGSGGWTVLERGPAGIDVGTNTLRFTTVREALVDSNGTAPQAGRFLERFEAFSRGSALPFFFGSPLQVSDTMPDQGHGTPYEVSTGLAQTGHARLWSSDPVRASNGAKGTFVYHVQASNLAADEDRFDLTARDVPDGWDVTLPAPAIRLDGNSTRSFPVLVTVPFEHSHGAFEDFVLEMRSQRDSGSVGRLQMGIRYLEVPQPAGHHDLLHIHTRSDAGDEDPFFSFLRGAGTAAYMNTLEDHDLDEDVPVPSQEGGMSIGSGTQWQWEVFLEPGLQMGMDFDRNRTGTIELIIDPGSGVDISNAELMGSLVHLLGERAPDGSLRGARTTTLAHLVAGSPVTVSGQTALSATLQPTADSDLVPYARDAALVLRVVLQGEAVSVAWMEQTRPTLLGGQMQLPLNEYRDRVEGVLNALAGLSFRHDSSAERRVNPAETVLFNLTLRNDGAVDDSFALRLNGTNADWARILGDQRIFVPTGRERAVVVAVRPPADAPHGDIVDLVVTAASQAEATIQGNIRVVATVDTAVDHPDESRLVQDVHRSLTKEKKSPLPLVLLPLLLAWWGRRYEVSTIEHK